MSFTGDLEYLPIVDVLQLLHASRKSGVLRIRGRRGESQLVFNDGYIVSASHLNNSVRIGKVLMDMGIITEESLDKALQAQASAAADRRPLIVTLVEMGMARKEDAYRGLEHLIEQTIVEVLRWKRGTFSLDAGPASSADDYRYPPDRINRDLSVDTQGALMEALRIYDEKMRDGLLTDDEEEDEADDAGVTGAAAETLLSADDLGLGNLDHIEARPRPLFASLNDEDPLRVLRSRLQELAPKLPDGPLQHLATYLLAKIESPMPSGMLPALIIFSPDELLCHCLTTLFTKAGMFVCTVREQAQLATVSKRCAILNSVPIIIFDTPTAGDSSYTAEREQALAQTREYQQSNIPLLQLADPGDGQQTLHAYTRGFRSVLPRPETILAADEDVDQLILFLESVRTLLDGCLRERANDPLVRLKSLLTKLLDLPTPQGVASSLLQQVADLGERSLTLVYRDGELIAEKGIGITADPSAGILPAPALRLPVSPDSLLQRVLSEGLAVSGPLAEPSLRDHLFPVIGAPLHPWGILLPVRRRGQALAVIYGDFGARVESHVNGDLLEMLAALASLVLDKTSRSAG